MENIKCKYCAKKNQLSLIKDPYLWLTMISQDLSGKTELFAMIAMPDGTRESREIDINFCPMCGEKLPKREKE